nr:MAG TPA_asm: hypothetical protein [Caudoviricetes sp.]DAP56579.1 MAG TPA: hypothetical protein [Caudoviricetes sp.]
MLSDFSKFLRKGHNLATLLVSEQGTVSLHPPHLCFG